MKDKYVILNALFLIRALQKVDPQNAVPLLPEDGGGKEIVKLGPKAKEQIDNAIELAAKAIPIERLRRDEDGKAIGFFPRLEPSHIKVHMTAFGEPDEIRLVDIFNCPDGADQGSDGFLDTVYLYGQNEFQPQKDHCSISGGDVIELGDGRLFIIQLPAGFKEITQEQFEQYKTSDRMDRQFSELVSAYKPK